MGLILSPILTMRRAIQLFGVVGFTAILAAQTVEQTAEGERGAVTIAARFDGLGAGFEGPQGTAAFRNPSDNSLAVGPNHVVQIVNSRMAIFSKAGRVLYGPMNTNNVFRGFGGTCEARNNGDAVVRYDQLANRWLIVMPIFSRAAERNRTCLCAIGLILVQRPKSSNHYRRLSATMF